MTWEPISGAEFLAMLRRLPADELELPATVLLERFDLPRCDDCGGHHLTVWAAFACDDFTAARKRRAAARAARAAALSDSARSHVIDRSVAVFDGEIRERPRVEAGWVA